MALKTKIVYRIAKLQIELRAIKAMTKEPAHRDALEVLNGELERVTELAANLLQHTPGEEAERRTTYPFAGLELQGFFEVEGARGPSLRASASAYGKRNGGRYVVKNQPNGTVRCYRVR